jgi:hypothetical protein
MSLLRLVILLIVIGVALWLINTYIPMSRSIKVILNVVIVAVVILYVLAAFGILGSFTGIRIGR